jgi:hypothetical protein
VVLKSLVSVNGNLIENRCVVVLSGLNNSAHTNFKQAGLKIFNSWNKSKVELPRERSPNKRPFPTSTQHCLLCHKWVCICSSSSSKAGGLLMREHKLKSSLKSHTPAINYHLSSLQRVSSSISEAPLEPRTGLSRLWTGVPGKTPLKRKNATETAQGFVFPLGRYQWGTPQEGMLVSICPWF